MCAKMKLVFVICFLLIYVHGANRSKLKRVSRQIEDKYTQIINQKCQEYATPLERVIPVLNLAYDAIPKNISRFTCDFIGSGLIANGTPVKPGEYPFMVALGYETDEGFQWICGGTLISDKFVLTAAHCRPRSPEMIVRLGDIHLKDNEGTQRIEMKIKRFISHPNHKRKVKYHDIALLELEQPIKLNKYIRPACLIFDDLKTVDTVIAAGWGKIEGGLERSDDLLKATLYLYANSLCNEKYGGIPSLLRGVTSDMICAGDVSGKYDTCQGDSGGPIFVASKNNQCVFYAVGITSFGQSLCSESEIPAVYTRVSSYIPWIVDTVWG